MKSDTMFPFKIALIVFLMIAVQFVAAFAMSSGVDERVRRNHAAAAEWNAQSLADNYGGTITENLNRAKSWDEASGASGASGDRFDFAGILSGSTLTVGDRDIFVRSNVRDNLAGKTFNVYTMKELETSDDPGEDYLMIYGEKRGDDVRLVFQSQEKFFEDLPDFGFSNGAIASESGRLMTGVHAGENLSEFLGVNLSEIFGKTATVTEVEFDGEKSLLAVAPIGFSESKFYAVGTLNSARVQTQIRNETVRTVLIVVLMSVATAALMLIFLLMFVLRDRKARLAAGMEYVVVCDRKGNILKSNSYFKSLFECKNIFEDAGSAAVNGLEEGSSMVLPLIDNLGIEHLAGLVVARKKSDYILTGRDTLMKKSSEEVRSFGMQRSIDLQSDFKRFSARGKVLVGVIEIVNLATLEAMFGKLFCEKVYYAVSEKAKRRFSSFYAMIPDQIGILFSDEHDADEITRDLPQILDELNRPVRIEDNLINAVCRAGFAIVDDVMVDKDFDYVLRCVDAALKKATQEDRQSYFIYHESQRKQYQKYMDKTCDIRKMLDEDSFELEFQPQFSLTENRVCGFESLFRVKKHLSLEMNTQELIDYAERSGSMILLGNFIFTEGMKFAKRMEGRGVTVSLNVSPVQLMQAGFVANFLSIYREFHLKPGSICVEITETFLMTNFDETLAKLKLLTSNGICVHLDDFGVSYSSLLYLKTLPIDALKIDREFISDIETNDYSKAITTFIIRLAKQLKLSVISEGVETEGQKSILSELGCDTVQGYLTGRSMPLEKAAALVEGEKSTDEKSGNKKLSEK